MLGSRLIYIKRLASSVRNLNEEEKEVFNNQLKNPEFIDKYIFRL